jgi:hypothetical protein
MSMKSCEPQTFQHSLQNINILDTIPCRRVRRARPLALFAPSETTPFIRLVASTKAVFLWLIVLVWGLLTLDPYNKRCLADAHNCHLARLTCDVVADGTYLRSFNCFEFVFWVFPSRDP